MEFRALLEGSGLPEQPVEGPQAVLFQVQQRQQRGPMRQISAQLRTRYI